MKKTYMKPGLYVESFSLAQSVATGCGAAHDSTLGHHTWGDHDSCGWAISIGTIWTHAPACNMIRDENFALDGVCYNNPDGGQNIFAS